MLSSLSPKKQIKFYLTSADSKSLCSTDAEDKEINEGFQDAYESYVDVKLKTYSKDDGEET